LRFYRQAEHTISWHVTTKVPVRDARGTVMGLAGYTRELVRATVPAGRSQEMAVVMEYLERHSRATIAGARPCGFYAHRHFSRPFTADLGVAPATYRRHHRAPGGGAGTGQPGRKTPEEGPVVYPRAQARSAAKSLAFPSGNSPCSFPGGTARSVPMCRAERKGGATPPGPAPRWPPGRSARGSFFLLNS
jgi:hypothetical protein